MRRRSFSLPAGITGAFAVALVPLAVYGFQSALGWWADGRPYREYHTRIDWRWLTLELATLSAGTAMVWRYRLPFLILPVACTLWYMSMDLALLLFGEDPGWQTRKWVSLVFGMIALGAALSRRVLAVFGGLGTAGVLSPAGPVPFPISKSPSSAGLSRDFPGVFHRGILLETRERNHIRSDSLQVHRADEARAVGHPGRQRSGERTGRPLTSAADYGCL